ncbi:ABC transporter permease [Bifidobacterium biavatii]|uniref:ABC transporter permease n=1 Tax=Bifidobacterium biavatii DSM 23969 TaxID=1437608 RepID=A0A086ZLY3_9BIFI|nr:ABC transporter permease [Bifidobacterium biavatii]KFI47533.1 ABC transporter permease [Bifidobacterium biavatii DSM 23969]
MDALKFLGKRLANLILLLFVLSLVTFGLLYMTNSDPARTLAGAKKVSAEQLAAIRAQYHLDDPLWRQYLRWLNNLLHGDFGTSIRTQLPVSQMIGQRAWITLALALLALAIALVIGLPLGILAARRNGRWQDRLVTALAVAGLSAPSFAVGLLLLYGLSVQLGWFPIYGLGEGGFLDTLWHLLLPAITLAVGLFASVVKISRASLIKQVDSDYTLFARSRGVARRTILAAQLRNAALPIITSSGLLIATLVSGTVIVETTFAIGGLGTLLQTSVTFKDIPTVQAITMIMATIICVATAVVDALAALIDPRLRVRRSPVAVAAVAVTAGSSNVGRADNDGTAGANVSDDRAVDAAAHGAGANDGKETAR